MEGGSEWDEGEETGAEHVDDEADVDPRAVQRIDLSPPGAVGITEVSVLDAAPETEPAAPLETAEQQDTASVDRDQFDWRKKLDVLDAAIAEISGYVALQAAEIGALKGQLAQRDERIKNLETENAEMRVHLTVAEALLANANTLLTESGRGT